MNFFLNHKWLLNVMSGINICLYVTVSLTLVFYGCFCNGLHLYFNTHDRLELNRTGPHWSDLGTPTFLRKIHLKAETEDLSTLVLLVVLLLEPLSQTALATLVLLAACQGRRQLMLFCFFDTIRRECSSPTECPSVNSCFTLVSIALPLYLPQLLKVFQVVNADSVIFLKPLNCASRIYSRVIKVMAKKKLSRASLSSTFSWVHINCSTCCWCNGDQRAPVGPVLSSAVIYKSIFLHLKKSVKESTVLYSFCVLLANHSTC